MEVGLELFLDNIVESSAFDSWKSCGFFKHLINERSKVFIVSVDVTHTPNYTEKW